MALPERVLLTGGSGFLGTHLARRLASAGVEVRLLDLRPPPATSVGPRITFTQGDVRDVPVLAQLLEGCGAVVHLADLPVEGEGVREGLEANFLGTWNVAEAAKRAKVGRVVLASSCSVYGAAGPSPLAEARGGGPVTLVGASKVGAEALLRVYAEQGMFEALALRFFHVYGRGRIDRPVPGVLARFGASVAAGRPPEVHGSGEALRDFLYIDDATEAVRLALERRVAAWTVANIGSGVGTSIRTAAEAVCTALGRPDLEPVSVDPPPGVQVSSFADTRVARSTLGLTPKTSLAEGLGHRDFHLPFE